MKYIDKEGQVQMLVIEKQPFKGVDNYSTNALLYKDVQRQDHSQKSPSPTNKEDVELKPEGEGVCELDLSALKG